MVTTHKTKGCKHKTKIKKCSKGIKKKRKYYTPVGNFFDGHREFPYACMIWLISSKHEHSRLISLLTCFTKNVDLFVVRIAVSCTLSLVPHIHRVSKQRSIKTVLECLQITCQHSIANDKSPLTKQCTKKAASAVYVFCFVANISTLYNSARERRRELSRFV